MLCGSLPVLRFKGKFLEYICEDLGRAQRQDEWLRLRKVEGEEDPQLRSLASALRRHFLPASV